MKKCTKCGKIKDVLEFHKRSKSSDGLQSWCKECSNKDRMRIYFENPEKQKEYAKRRRAENRKKLWLYLSEHSCIDCGETNPMKLDFDHVRGEKEFDLACATNNYGWTRIKKEIDKCEIRCANCHRVKTGNELGWWGFVNDI